MFPMPRAVPKLVFHDAAIVVIKIGRHTHMPLLTLALVR